MARSEGEALEALCVDHSIKSADSGAAVANFRGVGPVHPGLSHDAAVGGVIMPHGALILDPTRLKCQRTLNSAKKLHDACVAAWSNQAQRPDLILLYTPHGLIADGVDMNIYTNEPASGLRVDGLVGRASSRRSLRQGSC